MEIKGIDVSSYQGKPDWKRVKNDGVKVAILRAHQRDGIDTSFEHNYKGCVDNKIPVGVYKFSYAMNAAESEAEAAATLKVLNKRKLDLPVFLDMEYAEQKKLPKNTVTQIVKVFCDKVKAAGYTPAIYCNSDWYKNVLDTSALKYDYWIAAYPANDNGTVQDRLRPGFGIAWQYSSKGKVDGINRNVDMNLFYKDYTNGKITADKKEDKPATKKVNQAKLIMDKAISFMGVKENPPGSNNVIFNTDYYGGPVNGSWYPWCCAFVWDIFRMCGLSKLFYNGQKTAYCPTVENWARQNGQIVNKAAAKYGDIILFDWGGDGVADHIGFVESYSNGVYTTIEGNTSDGNDSNGGIVMRRTRYPSSVRCIVRPKYTNTTVTVSNDEANWKGTGTATSAVNNLYIRTEPSTNAVVLGELMKGNRFEINGEKSGKWIKVKVANVGVGWVHSDYVSYDGKPATSTTIKKKQNKDERLFVGKVMATALNVRSWAGTGNPQIKSYPQLGQGNLVDVMNFTQKDEYGAKWYYVRIAGKYFGFVKAEFIAKQ